MVGYRKRGRFHQYFRPDWSPASVLCTSLLFSGHQGIIDGSTRRLQSSRNELRGIAASC